MNSAPCCVTFWFERSRKHCVTCAMEFKAPFTLAPSIRSRSGRSHATLPASTREDGERCVTPARAAAKETTFTLVRTNLCTDRERARFHHGFTRDRWNWTNFWTLSVQIWDLKKTGHLFDRHGSIFVRARVNAWTMQLFAHIARLWPGIKCRDWSELCTDPCQHHCNRICTDPCKLAVQEQNSSEQKIGRIRVM